MSMRCAPRTWSLHQHIEGHRSVDHIVRPRAGSQITIFVGAEDYSVNSRHHQAVDRIGRGLIARDFRIYSAFATAVR